MDYEVIQLKVSQRVKYYLLNKGKKWGHKGHMI